MRIIRPMTLSVHPLNVGDLQLDNTFWVWQTDPGTLVWRPTTAFLILGGADPVLVDTSFRSVDDASAKQGLVSRRSDEQSLPAQLRRFGLEPGDIKLVMHTHLHMDHAGQDYLLPNATIHIRRAELQNAAAPNLYPVAFYDRLNIARLVDELFDRVDVADGDETVVEGIRTKHLPGHTPGHQVVIVDTGDGPAVICGDAAMDLEVNVRQQIAPGFLDSMSHTMSGLRWLAARDRQGDHVLAAHDAKVFERYPEGVGTADGG
jgi:glyoxylase-like metal-dependent hydrolase (beta-lactamase superfamily II)